MSDELNRLRRSWDANARSWTEAVRNESIESRRLVTNAAIVETVRAYGGRRVLDLGCGEGWLARALAAHGHDVTGIDASAALIAEARALGSGEFFEMSYDQLAIDARFDTIVANFSLLDDRTEQVLTRLRPLVDGHLIIQTTHPLFLGGGIYADGWRTETFSNLPGEWREPMPWYFRTLGSWIRVLTGSGYRIVEVREPLYPDKGVPASIIFICGAPASRAG
ncbi:MAG: class I SAM-dependent methyltransferase [Thermoanaerobaculia bacterium]